VVIAHDLDKDGELDVAVANYLSNSVSVFLGKGDATFKPKVDYPAGSGAYFLTAGDLNQDKVLDLIVTNVKDNSVSVLLNGACTL